MLISITLLGNRYLLSVEQMYTKTTAINALAYISLIWAQSLKCKHDGSVAGEGDIVGMFALRIDIPFDVIISLLLNDI
jgi:hypothetical protein